MISLTLAPLRYWKQRNADDVHELVAVSQRFPTTTGNERWAGIGYNRSALEMK